MEDEIGDIMYREDKAGEKLGRVEYYHNFINLIMDGAASRGNGYTDEEYSTLHTLTSNLLDELPLDIDGLQIDSEITVIRCDKDKKNKNIAGDRYIFFFENNLEYLSSSKRTTSE